MNSQFDFEFKHPDCERAVLLLHGLTATPIEMHNYGKFLHKARFDVYCHCLPGHGKTISDFKGVTWRDWLDFSMSEFKQLKKTYKEVYISGLCLGAVLSVAVALTEDVSGIVALSTTLYLDGWALPWYKFLIPILSYTIFRFYYLFPESDPYGVKNEIIRAKVSSMVKENVVAYNYIPMASFVELLKLSKYLRRRLHEVRSPIMIIHSEEDDLSSMKSAARIYGNVSSEIKELVTLSNSYHLIIVDNENEFVMKKSTEFLENISLKKNAAARSA